MNKFTRMKEMEEMPAGGRYSTSGRNRVWMWAFTAKVIMIAVLIFGAHFARVVFKAKTESLNKEAVRIERQITSLKQETMHLRNRKAALSAKSYIRERTRKLGLRAADYRQVKHVALLQEPRYAPGVMRTDYADEGTTTRNRSYASTGKETKKEFRSRKDPAVF
ncbi:MAG: hypothetical protein J6S53_03120 [Lentisphaeria bacterium]|nr:hypothetical protein [Lentisphaeria bacterium]